MTETEASVAAAGAATDASGRASGAPEELPDSVLVRVRDRLPEFTGALQRVAEQVLNDPAGAARATIVELAERSGTSPATVTRFCRALGFEGYAELRLGIAGETGRAARTAGWSVASCSSACTASGWPPGAGRTSTTGWPAPPRSAPPTWRSGYRTAGRAGRRSRSWRRRAATARRPSR